MHVLPTFGYGGALSSSFCSQSAASSSGKHPSQVEFRTSLQPEKIVSAKFLASGCYGTIFALDGIFSLWERWQDIPPSEPVHFARVNQDLLFGVNPTCRAGDAVVEVRGLSWLVFKFALVAGLHTSPPFAWGSRIISMLTSICRVIISRMLVLSHCPEGCWLWAVCRRRSCCWRQQPERPPNRWLGAWKSGCSPLSRDWACMGDQENPLSTGEARFGGEGQVSKDSKVGAWFKPISP